MVSPSPPAKSSPTGWFEPCATISEPESPESLNGPGVTENWFTKWAWKPGKQTVSVNGK